MPPVLVAAGIAAIIAWLLSGGKQYNKLIAYPQSPWNTQQGIVTGFPSPPVQTSVPTSGIGDGTTANAPATASSGVPNYAPQTAFQAPAPISPPNNPLPGFYETYSPHAYDDSSQNSIDVMVPHRMKKSSCGCGGGCGSNGGSSTSCTSAKLAGRDSDCLAPSKDAQYLNTDPNIFRMWADNIQSQKYGMFAAHQLALTMTPGNSETGAPNDPASPFLDGGLGIGNRASYGY